MKLTVDREALSQAFQVASTVVPTRSTIPVLQNIKLTARQESGAGIVEVVGTDLEVGVRLTVPAVEIAQEGTAVLPAARLGGLLRESPDKTVAIETDGHLAEVRFADSRYKIQGVDPQDFQDLAAFNAKGAVQVDTAELSEMIRKTIFAVSAEITRYALTGLLFEVRDKELRLVASDGKRLAYVKRKAAGGGKELKVIVPPKAMTLLEKILTPDDPKVALNVEENQIRFRTSKGMIFSRLIEGNFPDYEAVVPSGGDKKIALPREELASALRRTVLLMTDKSRAVKLTFTKGKVVCYTRTQDVGEAKIEIPLEGPKEECEIIFNPDYLLDVLRVTDGETIELTLKDRNTAGVFRSGKDYLYLVMPLTISM